MWHFTKWPLRTKVLLFLIILIYEHKSSKSTEFSFASLKFCWEVQLLRIINQCDMKSSLRSRRIPHRANSELIRELRKLLTSQYYISKCVQVFFFKGASGDAVWLILNTLKPGCTDFQTLVLLLINCVILGILLNFSIPPLSHP